MTIDIAIAKPARQTLPALSAIHLALAAACFALLLAPALWNSYPLLQYDTGGYLARWYEGYLVPSRSTVFGLFLHLGEGLHFWPDLLLQTACAIWVISLVLRVTGLAARPWHRIAVVTWLSLGTALPFLASALLTDIFAGVGVLALYLLIYHRPDLGRGDRIGLFFLIAFAVASHSATLAVLAAVLGFAAACLPSDRRRMAMLLPGGGALATGAAMLVKLCPYRDKLPATADEFLWNGGVFNELGRFDGLGEEMRFIVLHSFQEYPVLQFETALAATAKQLGQFASGYGMHDQIEHTYGIIRRFISKEVPAMQHARQQRGELNFNLINRIHVPIAFGSMLFLLGLLVRAIRSGRFDEPARLAVTVTVAILANAFACGALSGPHDRYGARMVWIVAFTAAIAILRAIENVLSERRGRRSAALCGFRIRGDQGTA
jgi:hypothetical protein